MINKKGVNPNKKKLNMNGLSFKEAKRRQSKCGKNEFVSVKDRSFFTRIIDIICEPMFLLLIAAATIYFILGEIKDGVVMLVFVFFIINIEIIQEYKTDKTLKALKHLSSPKIMVIREGRRIIIESVDLVPGDLMIINEGVKIPADGFVVKLDGLLVDESTLTGESVHVYKTLSNTSNGYWKTNYCYSGTLVIGGSAIVVVDKIGSFTQYGRISKNISEQKFVIPPLKRQINKLVKICAIIAFLLFLIVVGITYLNLSNEIFKTRIIQSILSGITLAMAMIPEEFPVVLTVFLSLGAWRLAKKRSLVKRLSSVETLGEVSVLCVDKTGTLTENEMKVSQIYALKDEKELSEIMGMCCLYDAFDPMEKAMIDHCESLGITKEHIFSGNELKFFPFDNNSKMMGRLWNHDGEIILAVKGSYENIIKLCSVEDEKISDKFLEMSNHGYRVIAVAKGVFDEESLVQDNLCDNKLELCGLVALLDPPRESVQGDIEACYNAGIRILMITGDSSLTASSIASKVGIKDCDNVLTGMMIDELDDKQLSEKIKDVSICARVIPEHKMRIVKALQENGDVVAMSGDGVNDAAALKQADIGIAMGKKCSEVVKEAADLVLLDDNFSTIVDSVKDGRRIYDNIRKAIGYILIIHVPIALSALLAPILKIPTAALLLLPIHIVLLELIIDPTSSIVFERQPAEANIMKRKPRRKDENIVNKITLLKSIIQGLVIFLASFGTYYMLYKNQYTSVEVARSMALIIIVFSNLFLVQVNASEKEFAFKSLKKLMKDKVIWLVNILIIGAMGVILYTPLNDFFKLSSLPVEQLLFGIVLSFVSVYWYEIVKYFKKN